MERIGNTTKYLLIILLFTGALNILKAVNEMSLFILLVNAMPVLIMAAFIYILKIKHSKTNALILMAFSIPMTLLGGIGNFGGAIFISYSMREDPGRNKDIIKIFVSVVALMCKPFLTTVTAIDMIGLVFLYYSVIVLDLLIYRKVDNVNHLQIDDQTLQIVKYLAHGNKIKEIAAIVYMNESAVRKRIDRLEKKIGAKDSHELIRIVMKSGQEL